MKRKIALIGDSLTEGRPGVSFSQLLTEKYPNIIFDNLGKPGETVKSLHTRLTKGPLGHHYDLVFLWIGVNDVYTKLLKVQAQPVTENHEEFRAYFIKVLDLVRSSTAQIVVVSPAIIGENIGNDSNREIRALCATLKSIAEDDPSLHFLNMYSVFEKNLANSSSSDYINTNVFTVMKDVFFYKKSRRIDLLSRKRGLHLTLDGIHLNSKGASIVAEQFGSIIDQFLFGNDSTLEDYNEQ